MDILKKNEAFGGPEGPVVLVIMDGVGIGRNPESDFVKLADTPNLDWLRENAIYNEIKAHGIAVGLPDDSDMGNYIVLKDESTSPATYQLYLHLAQDSLESCGYRRDRKRILISL